MWTLSLDFLPYVVHVLFMRSVSPSSDEVPAPCAGNVEALIRPEARAAAGVYAGFHGPMRLRSAL